MEEKKIYILFLCTGNICRSPTAEGIFKKKIKEEKLEKFFEIDSAGTHGYHEGETPDIRSQRQCLKHKIDLSKIKSRKLNKEDLKKFDYIIAMDASHYNFVINKPHRGNCRLLLSYGKKNKITNVPDPYYGDEKNFIETFNIINEGIMDLINDIKNTHNLN